MWFTPAKFAIHCLTPRWCRTHFSPAFDGTPVSWVPGREPGLHGDGEREEEADDDELARRVAEDRRAGEQQVPQDEDAPVPASAEIGRLVLPSLALRHPESVRIESNWV